MLVFWKLGILAEIYADFSKNYQQHLSYYHIDNILIVWKCNVQILNFIITSICNFQGKYYMLPHPMKPPKNSSLFMLIAVKFLNSIIMDFSSLYADD